MGRPIMSKRALSGDPPLLAGAVVAGLGSLSLVAAALDRILLIVAFVVIIFWCGVGPGGPISLA